MNDAIMSDLEVLYRETRNPLFAWEALCECRPGEPLPSWIFDYLRGCARAWLTFDQPAWDQPSFYCDSSGRPLDPAVQSPNPRHRGVLDMAGIVEAVQKRYDEEDREHAAKEQAEQPGPTADNEKASKRRRKKSAASEAADLTARALGLKRDPNYNAFEHYVTIKENASKAFFLGSPAGKKRRAWLQIAGAHGFQKGHSRGMIYKDADAARDLWEAQRRAKDRTRSE